MKTKSLVGCFTFGPAGLAEIIHVDAQGRASLSYLDMSDAKALRLWAKLPTDKKIGGAK